MRGGRGGAARSVWVEAPVGGVAPRRDPTDPGKGNVGYPWERLGYQAKPKRGRLGLDTSFVSFSTHEAPQLGRWRDECMQDVPFWKPCGVWTMGVWMRWENELVVWLWAAQLVQ
eukprot:GGOE01010582.1.p4 GENE.GGOE01010582.1~~GGOE01010582.1.p4  ORF type:complete len:114 (-),score=3.32 GGOE01010582.1:259-600(-)